MAEAPNLMNNITATISPEKDVEIFFPSSEVLKFTFSADKTINEVKRNLREKLKEAETPFELCKYR